MSSALAFIEALIVVLFRTIIYCALAVGFNSIPIFFLITFGADKGLVSLRTVGVGAAIGFVVYVVLFIFTIVSYYKPFYWPVREKEGFDTFLRFIARIPVNIFLLFSKKFDRPNAEFYYTLYLFFSTSCWFVVALLLWSDLSGSLVSTSSLNAAIYDALRYTVDMFLKGVLLDFSEHFHAEIHNKTAEQTSLPFLVFTFSYRTLAGLIGLGAILKIVDLMKSGISRV